MYSNSKFSQMKGIKDPGQNGDCENGNEEEAHLGTTGYEKKSQMKHGSLGN